MCVTPGEQEARLGNFFGSNCGRILPPVCVVDLEGNVLALKVALRRSLSWTLNVIESERYVERIDGQGNTFVHWPNNILEVRFTNCCQWGPGDFTGPNRTRTEHQEYKPSKCHRETRL